MTIHKTAISFSNVAYTALQNCEAVHILVNENNRTVLVRPCMAKDPNAVLWGKHNKKSSNNRIECSSFTRQLYDAWGLNLEARYRTNGKLVQADKKVMLLFDFNHSEGLIGSKVVT